MKNSFLFIFLCMAGYANAQNDPYHVPDQTNWIQKDARFIFPGGRLSGYTVEDITENAVYYLKNSLPDLKNNKVSLVLTHTAETNYARYLDFVEEYNETEIFGTAIKIAVDKENNVLSVLSKTIDISNWAENTSMVKPDAVKMAAAIGPCDHYTWKPVWFNNETTGIAAWEVNCGRNDGSRHETLVLSTDYDIMYRNDLLKHYKYPDSLVTMFVFNPDPVTSARVPYAEPYTNHGDSDVAVLDSQMVAKTTRVSFVHDSFLLENTFIKLANLGAPYNELTWSKKPVFHFHRDTSAFRDIMVYYHLNVYRQRLQALGYEKIGKTQLQADADGQSIDESTFSHDNSGPKIFFGLGGIPDAEDADVPTHEYTHYLSYDACPDCADFGNDRKALDEGTADFFAAAYSKSISTYNWQKVYNWDGNWVQWPGRSCVYTGHYKENLVNEPHIDGQMWSSSLMQIQDSIGRDKAEIIMLETLYGMGKNMTMSDAARLYIKNDSLIFKGADARTCAHYFIQRGFLPKEYLGIAKQNEPVGYKIITNSFSKSNMVRFEFDESQSGTMALYDITGKLITTQLLKNQYQTDFHAAEIAKGIYILSVNTEGLHKSFKLVKN